MLLMMVMMMVMFIKLTMNTIKQRYPGFELITLFHIFVPINGNNAIENTLIRRFECDRIDVSRRKYLNP